MEKLLYNGQVSRSLTGSKLRFLQFGDIIVAVSEIRVYRNVENENGGCLSFGRFPPSQACATMS
ncbi:hypothetical protein LJC58_06465 [Lachnospiraceae bacterium OttesenSCG-928-D06]|nr:hypothetical protein [Lachnospiraceae bacterium OttesenSCG-928-D06]